MGGGGGSMDVFFFRKIKCQGINTDLWGHQAKFAVNLSDQSRDFFEVLDKKKALIPLMIDVFSKGRAFAIGA